MQKRKIVNHSREKEKSVIQKDIVPFSLNKLQHDFSFNNSYISIEINVLKK